MSTAELDRAEVLQRVLSRRLTRTKAARLLGLSERQTRRLCKAFARDGHQALVSKARGRPSNRKLPEALQQQAVELVRARYPDFGPKLAWEKLAEVHDIRVGRETLRRWMVANGIWLSRAARRPAPHQPRQRRDCLGELVQIDGCNHEWFEDRAPRCTLLVYVDDATGRLMELRFVQVESAFDYFAATAAYLRHHGKPVAFYSDKHSIFRVAREGTTGRNAGVSQFARALDTLNIDILCANSPQAKGRVERMNQTLQDRLVKELRLQGISTMDAANAFAPAFIADYNARFAVAPANPHDAHRPLRPDEDLERIFTWQEERTLSRNLVLHYKRTTYLVKPTPETKKAAGKRVRILERDDGQVELWHKAQRLPYSVFAPRSQTRPGATPGAVVENKEVSAALLVARAWQARQDEALLASGTLTLRERARLQATQAAAPTGALAPGMEAVLASMERNLETARRRKRRENAAGRKRRTARAAGSEGDGA